MKLTEKAIREASKGIRCRNRLALEFEVHILTIDRWLVTNEKNGRLTTPNALSIISSETGIDKSKLLTDGK